MAITRLTLESRKSNARIKLLDVERQSDESKMEYLKTLFRGLEKEMDDAVADLMDRSGSMTPDPNTTVLTKKDSSSAGHDSKALPTSTSSPASSKDCSKSKDDPLLTPVQITMAKQLNTIPHLKKKLVFIDNVMNSHGAIIARDARRFKDQERGMGVVRCWADGFEV